MSKATRASYGVLLACTITHFLNHLYTGALSPFLPFIQIELSLSYTEVGAVTSAAVIAMTISHLFVGYLGDKGWRDLFISVSILGSAVAMILTSLLSYSFIFLAIFQFALGVGASGYHPSVFPALSERFGQRDRAKATGIQAMGGLIGMAVTPFLGVTLYIALGGWRPSLLVLGLLGIVLLFPVTYLMWLGGRDKRNRIEETLLNGESEEEEEDGAEGWTRNYWLGLVNMGLRGMSFRCASLLMPVYLVATYPVSPIWAGYLTTIMMVSGLVGEMFSSWYSDHINRRVIFLVVSSTLVTPAFLLLNFALNEVALIVVLIIIGFFFFLGVPPNTAYLTEVSPKGKKGIAFGLLFSVGSIPGAVSPIIFGMIGDAYGLPASIMFLVTTTLLSTIVAIFMRDVNGGKARPSCPTSPPVEEIALE
ncbi:MAG: MFS transporter [Candidatus Thorarchaeota archaeon]